MASGYISGLALCRHRLWMDILLGAGTIIDTYWYLLYNTLPYITPTIRRAMKIEGWIWANIRNIDDLDDISCSCVFSHPSYLVCCLFGCSKAVMVSHVIFSGHWCRMVIWSSPQIPKHQPRAHGNWATETLRIIAVDCFFLRRGSETTY